jgi:7,8-dihydropterin-6-yl-methyl-4-(beta-D-ribofuranosyl)aminobenzene 5'-phosphate synthase
MIRKLKITTLVDNYALFGSRFWAEHGLSFLIEADGERILFDTGQSKDVIAHNLEKFNEDLSDLKYIVLSHGHYDHTGGLKEIARRIDNAEIFAHPNIFDEKYVKRDEKYIRIGIPFDIGELKKSYKFHLEEEGTEIIKGVRTTGQIPRITEFEQVPKRFYIKKNDKYISDKIIDDQSLILETQSGIMVILGCTHSGLINTLYHIKGITGKNELWGLIGGVHLWSETEERLQKTAKALKEFNPKIIGLSHCSGLNAFLYFSKVFGEKVFLNSAGSVIQI